MDLVQTGGYKFFEVCNAINQYSSLIIIVIGLIANLLTIYLLQSKSSVESGSNSVQVQADAALLAANPNAAAPNTKRKKKKKYNVVRISYRNRPGVVPPRSFSSSELYMFALACSDTIFLVAHLIEDLMPQLTLSAPFQFVNRNTILCKSVLYLRNSARFSSSYLIVFFAYERFTVIKSPLNRLKYSNKRFTRIIILIIFLLSMIINSYSLVINGLRVTERHEFREVSLASTTPNYNQTTECDVIAEFKSIYDYFVIFYVLLGTIVPLTLICYFNAYIAHVLCARKSHMLRDLFSQLEQQTQQQQQDLNNHLETTLPMVALQQQQSDHHQDTNQSQIHEHESMIPSNAKFFSSWRKPRSSAIERNRASTPNHNHDKAIGHQLPQALTAIGDANGKSTRSKSIDVISLIRSSGIANHRSIANGKSGSLVTTSQYSNYGLARKLKDSDRATLILILISVCFVCLNLPYVLTWANFFVPYKQKRLSESEVYARFAWVTLGEIFHIANFSINLFLYCLASKLFRNELIDRLSFLKSLRFNIGFKRRATI